MSNSKFAAADAAFQYDPTAHYEPVTFHNLSVKKCQNIASMLHIRNVKRHKKEQLIPLILQQHIEQSNSRMVELEDSEGIEETKGNDESAVVLKALSFNEQWKNNFNEIPYYTFNKQAWFKGNSVARYLEYEDPNQAVRDHVNDEDKMRLHELNMQISSTLFATQDQGKMHPDTFFINKFGILVLISKSRMPLARQFQKWLLDDVLPSIANTGAYISPNITDSQFYEFQKQLKIFEEEKKKFQQEKADLQLVVNRGTTIRTSIIERNQMRNLLPLEEIYILTTIEYDRSYLYKIGRSNNTAKRLKSLNTSRLKNDEMYICHISKCHDANTTENAIHNILSRYRYEQNREFFQVDFETLKKVVEWGCQCNETFYESCIALFEQTRYVIPPDINPKQTPPVHSYLLIEDKRTQSDNSIMKYFNKK